MKKFLAIAVASVMLFSLAACGGGAAPAPTQASTQATQASAQAAVSDSKLSKFFVDTFANGQGFISFESKMDVDGSGTLKDAVMDMYIKGESSYISISADAVSMAMLMDNSLFSIISHDEKMILQMPIDSESAAKNPASSGTSMIDTMGKVSDEEFSKGTEEINGKSYDYEEFTSDTSPVRYYFDGDTLCYIKSEIGTDKETAIKVLNYGSDVDEALFVLPADYQVLDLQSLAQSTEEQQ